MAHATRPLGPLCISYARLCTVGLRTACCCASGFHQDSTKLDWSDCEPCCVLLQTAEDLEDKPSLHALFRTMKAAIMLNDTALLEEMLKEEHVMDVMGCLEYDPDLPTQQHHRQFLQTNVVFKEVVPIHNQETLCKIHQTYRIQYLKDVILPRSLDDATYATLASLMLFNNVEVLMALQQDPTFLPKVRFMEQHTCGAVLLEWLRCIG